jgi:uncharacterized membrane-anchored protein
VVEEKIKKETGMNNTGKKVLGVGLGMLSALALVGCAFAVLRIGTMFPGLEHSPWAYWLAVLAIPEAIFVAATVMLWRKKRAGGRRYSGHRAGDGAACRGASDLALVVAPA